MQDEVGEKMDEIMMPIDVSDELKKLREPIAVNKEPPMLRGSFYRYMWRYMAIPPLNPGAPGGTRTHNLLIRSQALCPLSYGGVRWIIP